MNHLFDIRPNLKMAVATVIFILCFQAVTAAFTIATGLLLIAIGQGASKAIPIAMGLAMGSGFIVSVLWLALFRKRYVNERR